MACRLTPPLLALAAALTGLASQVLAQGLPDPTRPPGNAEYGSAGYASSGLQSIIRPTGQKPRALIHGELVTLGGKVGESQLIAINTDSVVLRDADGNRETLTLTPGISKSPAKNKSSATR